MSAYIKLVTLTQNTGKLNRTWFGRNNFFHDSCATFLGQYLTVCCGLLSKVRRVDAWQSIMSPFGGNKWKKTHNPSSILQPSYVQTPSLKPDVNTCELTQWNRNGSSCQMSFVDSMPVACSLTSCHPPSFCLQTTNNDACENFLFCWSHEYTRSELRLYKTSDSLFVAWNRK